MNICLTKMHEKCEEWKAFIEHQLLYKKAPGVVFARSDCCDQCRQQEEEDLYTEYGYIIHSTKRVKVVWKPFMGIKSYFIWLILRKEEIE
jgi:hypothetical protein